VLKLKYIPVEYLMAVLEVVLEVVLELNYYRHHMMTKK
jgi:hypothetical protein